MPTPRRRRSRSRSNRRRSCQSGGLWVSWLPIATKGPVSTHLLAVRVGVLALCRGLEAESESESKGEDTADGYRFVSCTIGVIKMWLGRVKAGVSKPRQVGRAKVRKRRTDKRVEAVEKDLLHVRRLAVGSHGEKKRVCFLRKGSGTDGVEVERAIERTARKVDGGGEFGCGGRKGRSRETRRAGRKGNTEARRGGRAAMPRLAPLRR